MRNKDIKNILRNIRQKKIADDSLMLEMRQNIEKNLSDTPPSPQTKYVFRLSFKYTAVAVIVFLIIGSTALAASDIDISSPLYPLKYNIEEAIVKTAPKPLQKKITPAILKKRLRRIEIYIKERKNLNPRTKDKILKSVSRHLERLSPSDISHYTEIISQYSAIDKQKAIQTIDRVENKIKSQTIPEDRKEVLLKRLEEIKQRIRQTERRNRFNLQNAPNKNIEIIKERAGKNGIEFERYINIQTDGNKKIDFEKSFNNGQVQIRSSIQATGTSVNIKVNQKIKAQSKTSIKIEK